MATTQTSQIKTRHLTTPLPLSGDKILYHGFVLVLVVSILMVVWSPELWPLTGSQVGVFTLLIIGVFRYAFSGVSWPQNWLQLLLIVAPVWGLMQLETSRTVYRFETWAAVLNWTVLAAAFPIACQMFATESIKNRFRIFAIYVGGLLALWAILQLFSGEGQILWYYKPRFSEQPMGPFLNRDHYSAFIELLLPMALWEAFNDRRRSVLFGGLAALMYASVIAGASRAGSVLVNLEVGAVVLLALARKSSTTRVRSGQTILKIALLIFTFSAIVGWDVLLQRFQQKDPFQGRREFWQSGIAMIHDHPWFGFGLGTWTTAYQGYSVYDDQAFVNAAHSDWLQWAGEGGIPFFLLMLVVAGRALQLGIRTPWGLGVTFVFLHSLVDFPLQKLSIFLWLIVILAAMEMTPSRKFSQTQ